jgi:hypothetical protein
MKGDSGMPASLASVTKNLIHFRLTLSVSSKVFWKASSNWEYVAVCESSDPCSREL